jgi:hypothetical protein
VDEPGDGDERIVLQGWLEFHRSALAAKCAGLDAAQLVTASSPPSNLTVLGLVRHAADALLRQHPSLDAIGTGNGRSVRWNLQKLVGEYARHNGHADLLRERIDGSTGES